MIKERKSMIQKNIFRATLVLFGAAMLTTACTFQEDDFFDESASLRVTHTNEQLQDRLVKQSSDENYGWVIQYFVAGTDELDFEGFNLFGRFYDTGKVTLAGNHRFLRNGNANKYTEHSSTYEWLSEEGPVLSFNTWNDILTVFEDPVDPSTQAQNGEGMFGDHSLVLRSYNDDEIVFSGERHSAKVRFIACDRPWTDYIDAVNKTKSDISSTSLTSYYVTNGTDTMFFSNLNRGYFNYCDRVDDPLNNKVLSCVFTPTGFRIENPDTLGGNSFQEFTVAADSTCLQNEDGSVKVIATWDNYILNRTKVWNFDPESYTEEQQALVNQIADELTKRSSAWSLQAIGMGRSSGNKAVSGIVVSIYTNARKTSTTTVGLSVLTSKTGFGQLKFEEDPALAVDGNMNSVVSNGATELANLVRAFAETIYGVYDLTPDNYFLPTGCAYSPVEEGTAFKLK